MAETSLFDLGCDDASGNVGLVSFSPGEVRQAVVSTAALMQATDRDVGRSKLGESEKRAWGRAFAEWQDFQASNTGITAVPNYLRDSVYERARRFRGLAYAYREKIAVQGSPVATLPGPSQKRLPIDAQPIVPDGVTPPGVSLNPKDSGLSLIPWKKLLVVGGLAAGAYFLYKAFRSSPQIRLLQAPGKLVNNPPSWARDPDVWETAKLAVKANSEGYDNPEAVTVHVYKQLGGRVDNPEGDVSMGPIHRDRAKASYANLPVEERARYKFKVEVWNPNLGAWDLVEGQDRFKTERAASTKVDKLAGRPVTQSGGIVSDSDDHNPRTGRPYKATVYRDVKNKPFARIVKF